jgi:uncharacterized LabA/DUF88 family protein
MLIGGVAQFRAKRWMLFVDGENLTIRAQNLASSKNWPLEPGPYWKEDCFLWAPGIAATGAFSGKDEWGRDNWASFEVSAVRAHYYTSVQGDQRKTDGVRSSLWSLGFEPRVFRKPKGKPSKGVDISLATDMLRHAQQDHYDGAFLIAGDADFVPLVEEIKRLGKIVTVGFFRGPGLGPELRLAADHFADLTQWFGQSWRDYRAPTPSLVDD